MQKSRLLGRHKLQVILNAIVFFSNLLDLKILTALFVLHNGERAVTIHSSEGSNTPKVVNSKGSLFLYVR